MNTVTAAGRAAVVQLVSLAVAETTTNTTPRITTQPRSQTAAFGRQAILTVVASGAVPLRYQWRKGEVNVIDDGRISGSQKPALIINRAVLSDAGPYSVTVTNTYGSAVSSPALLTIIHPSYPAPNDLVQALAMQSDGKLLVGGDFTEVGGLSRRGVARFNKDGTVDEDFTPVADDRVTCLAVQPDDSILVGGERSN